MPRRMGRRPVSILPLDGLQTWNAEYHWVNCIPSLFFYLKKKKRRDNDQQWNWVWGGKNVIVELDIYILLLIFFSLSLCKFIQIWCFHSWISSSTPISISHIICKKNQNIRFRGTKGNIDKQGKKREKNEFICPSYATLLLFFSFSRFSEIDMINLIDLIDLDHFIYNCTSFYRKFIP